MMDMVPMPGSTGFLILCLGLYLAMVNALTLYLCRLDRRLDAEGRAGIPGWLFVLLAVLGGWPAMKYELWFEANRAGGMAVAWAVTVVAAVQVVTAGAIYLPGRLPDMTVGEMLTQLMQGKSKDDKPALPRRFGPGADS